MLSEKGIVVATYHACAGIVDALGGRVNYLILDARGATEMEQLVPLILDPLRIVIVGEAHKSDMGLFSRLKASHHVFKS